MGFPEATIRALVEATKARSTRSAWRIDGSPTQPYANWTPQNDPCGRNGGGTPGPKAVNPFWSPEPGGASSQERREPGSGRRSGSGRPTEKGSLRSGGDLRAGGHEAASSKGGRRRFPQDGIGRRSNWWSGTTASP